VVGSWGLELQTPTSVNCGTQVAPSSKKKPNCTEAHDMIGVGLPALRMEVHRSNVRSGAWMPRVLRHKVRRNF